MNKLMTVAVIDSGIYPHIDFKNRIVAFKDFVNGRKNAYDDCGHGTHVSGIIAGSGYASHGRIKGICPAARLAGIKVLDRLGNGRIENVNISFGATTFGEKENLIALEKAIEKLWDNNIIVVAAAGNDGPGRQTVAIPGTCKKIITVGSPDGKDFYSGRGPTSECIVKPELIVNGSYIRSCNNSVSGYSVKSGTSMSAPVVSGAIADVLIRKDMSPKEIKKRLHSCCTKKALPDNLQGWGLLNLSEFMNI